ncbi:hypothetical protein [Mobiluncus mulieris]|uniref:hypothetical protein n=1 Tax=Mobiluncus mulieris TaxID=2052 RepID=UPI003211C00B
MANPGFVTGGDSKRLDTLAGVGGESGVFGVFGWGLVVISGFFGTGWPIWLQVWVLFPEIATIPPPKP